MTPKPRCASWSALSARRLRWEATAGGLSGVCKNKTELLKGAPDETAPWCLTEIPTSAFGGHEMRLKRRWGALPSPPGTRICFGVMLAVGTGVRGRKPQVLAGTAGSGFGLGEGVVQAGGDARGAAAPGRGGKSLTF